MSDWWSEATPVNPMDVALEAEKASPKVAALAKSIYQQESTSGKNTATSNAGAVGGMQVIPSTFKEVADKGWSIHDPIDNARAGIRYAAQMLDKSGGNIPVAAAGYYGGPGGLEKAKKGVAVSDPRNPNAPNTLQYGAQVASRVDEGKWWADAPAVDQQSPAVPPPAAVQMPDAALKAAGAERDPKAIARDVLMQQLQPGFAERFASGGMSGLKNTAIGLSQRVWDAIKGNTSGDVSKYAADRVAQLQQMSEPPTTGVPEALGNAVNNALLARYTPPIAQTGPAASMAGRTIQGAGIGSLIGVTQPAPNPETALANAGMSGLAGGVATPLLELGGRAVAGAQNADAQRLRDVGITPTPGQILGGAYQRTEDKARSLFGIGDAITMGQARPMRQLNTAIYNNVLGPIGEKVPSDLPVGKEGIEYVHQRASNAYNDALAGVTYQPDQKFFLDVFKTARDAGNKLPPAQRSEFREFLQNNVFDKIQNGGGQLTGKEFKSVDEDIVNQINTYMGSQDQKVSNRATGQFLEQVRSALRDSFDRSNPQNAAALNAADETWARFTRLRDAGTKVTGVKGNDVITPGQFQMAVRSQDARGGGKNFAEGNALMQDLTGPAARTLSQNYPDSGTAGRHAIAQLIGGGVLAGTGNVAPYVAATAGAYGMYSPAGQRAMASMLMDRPELVRQFGQLIQGASPLLGGGLGAAYEQQR